MSDTSTDGGDDETGDEDNQKSEQNTTISCTLGGLDLSVEGPDPEAAEAMFERVWERRMEEAQKMSDAMRERLLWGHQ